MSDIPTSCPQCGSAEVQATIERGRCAGCGHVWPLGPEGPPPRPRPCVFLSYGRLDAEPLAERLDQDLTHFGYEVWRDKRRIRSGKAWSQEIEDGLRSTQVLVALLSPHAVRKAVDPDSPDGADSVCLDEIAYARHERKVPIVPVMAVPCRPPLDVFRLDYIEMLRWRDFGEHYQTGFARLREALEAGLRGDVLYRPWEDRLRPIDFTDYLFAKRRDFCGRGWLFEAIELWRADPARPKALLITGDPGIGKSAVVAQLVHANPGGQVLAHHCCQFLSRETIRPGRFVRSLAAQIASQLDAYADRLDDPAVAAALLDGRGDDDPLGAFDEGVLAPLHALPAPPGGVRYLLVDALDEALAHRDGLTIADVLAHRLDRLPGWLRVVATARKEPDVLRRLSGLRAEEIRADDPRNLDDLDGLLALRLGQSPLSERLARSAVPPEEARALLREKCRGNFLVAQQALAGLATGAYDFARLDDLPPGLIGHYVASFERHFPDAAS